ncbi:MAG: type II toxin-antitoxin system HicA family toxin [Bacteroides sp.]|nr:type II toxin-antitoxin system HicA family toxin [Bacteroides sp.]
MKYSEIHRKLKKAGCYPLGKDIAGDPAWYSPITGKVFPTSHHDKEEAKQGTKRNIEKQSGVKL